MEDNKSYDYVSSDESYYESSDESNDESNYETSGEFNKSDICICDKTNPLHYAIVNKMLILQEYVNIGKYNCSYCYKTFENHNFNYIEFDEIKNIYHNGPDNILDIKNKNGHTPLKLINKFIKLINFELKCTYLKHRTYRQLNYSKHLLYEIKDFLLEELKLKKDKYDIQLNTLLCSTKFQVQLPPEMWMKIFEYI
jgi:hypothetical protein